MRQDKSGVTEQATDFEEHTEENFTPIFLLKSPKRNNISAEKHKVKTEVEQDENRALKGWCSLL